LFIRVYPRSSAAEVPLPPFLGASLKRLFTDELYPLFRQFRAGVPAQPGMTHRKEDDMGRGDRMKARCMLALLAVMTVSGYAQTPADRSQPFTAELKARYWTESGRTIEESWKFVRATDGSWAFESDDQDPALLDQAERGWFRYTFDVKRRRYIDSLSFVQAAVVKPVVDAQELKMLRGSYGTCDGLNDGSLKQLGRSTFLGLEVIDVEVEHDERSIIEEWVAPALQCFALKRTEVIDGNLRQRIQAVSVQLGEPDAGAFELPAGFARVSPLEMEDLYRARFPGRELFGSRIGRRLEEEYQRALSSAPK
jgi:hypothetical protein